MRLPIVAALLLITFSAAAEDLSLSLTSPAWAGQGATVNVLYTVTGGTPSGTIQFTLPSTVQAGYAFGASKGCTIVTGSRGATFTCEATANGGFTYTVDQDAEPGLVITPTGQLTALDDPNSSNDSASVSTTVVGPADVAIAAAAPSFAVTNTPFEVAVTVTNHGPSEAKLLTVLLGVNQTVLDKPPTASCSVPSTELICTMPSLPTGASAAFRLRSDDVQFRETTVGTTVLVFAANGDPASGNNVTSYSVSFSSGSNWSLTGTATPSVHVNDVVTCVLQPHVSGPSLDATLAYTVPANAAFTSGVVTTPGVVDTECTQSGSTVYCRLRQASDHVTLTMKATAPGAMTHTATVTAPGDPQPADNTITLTTDVLPARAADLAVTLTPAAATVSPLVDTAVAMRVTNRGPEEARDVVARVTLPPALTLSPAPVGCRQAQSNVVECTFASLLAGASNDMTIHATAALTLGVQTIEATVSGSTTDSDPTNNSARALFDIEYPATVPDLVMTVAPDHTPVYVGEPVRYTYTVTNAGTAAAAGIGMFTASPASLQPVAAEFPSQGCIWYASGEQGFFNCLGGSVAAGQSVSWSVTFIPKAAGSMPTHATVTTSTAERVTINNSVTIAVDVVAKPELPTRRRSVRH
jgi:uncharacterized repeat protein (TIGR01451 family)